MYSNTSCTCMTTWKITANYVHASKIIRAPNSTRSSSLTARQRAKQCLYMYKHQMDCTKAQWGRCCRLPPDSAGFCSAAPRSACCRNIACYRAPNTVDETETTTLRSSTTSRRSMTSIPTTSIDCTHRYNVQLCKESEIDRSATSLAVHVVTSMRSCRYM